MFDLEQAISAWRRQLAAGGVKSPEILDELESHLRDDVEQRMRSGLAAKQAFEAAAQQMGPVMVLKTEFAGVKRGYERQRSTVKAICCVVFAGIIALASSPFRVGMNLGATLLVFAAIAYIVFSVRGRQQTGRFQKGLGNLSLSGKQTLQLACEEAPRLQHNYVGTEHVLLGLTRLETGPVANVMKRLGLNREVVQQEVEQFVHGFPAQQAIGNIPYTPRVRKTILLATREAKRLNHERIGGEDIFLGLLLEGDGVAARVLKKLGVQIEQTRAAILEESTPSGHQS
jgi:hypothetical protein